MTAPRTTVLLVDDEPHPLSALQMALEDEFDCVTARDAEAGVAAMGDERVQIVICDQRMPGRIGVGLLTELRERWPEAVRIIVTGYTDPGAMAQAINDAGIHQFLTRPWHPEQLLMAARNGARLFALARELRFLASSAQGKLDKQRVALRKGLGFQTILRSPQSPIRLTPHGRRPRLAPCGVNRIGLAQKADRGTLFVAGVEHASSALQLALWRVVEEGSFTDVRGQEVLTSNLRLIAAAGGDLARRVADGAFRVDLDYALAVAELAIPRRRARRGDVAIRGAGVPGRPGRPARQGGAGRHLVRAGSPGKLGQARHPARIAQRGHADAGLRAGAGPGDRPHQPSDPAGRAPDIGADRSGDEVLTADGRQKDRVELTEMRILRETLTRHRRNNSRAAVALGISRAGLRAKLDRYGIADPSGRVTEEEED